MRSPYVTFAALAMTMTSFGCGSAQCPSPAAPPGSNAPTGDTVLAAASAHDLVADRATSTATDRDFAKATAEHGVDGWVSFFADDGARIIDKKGLVRGHDAIRALVAPLLSDPDRRLERETSDASGDLGWTYGHARLMRREAGEWRVAAKMQYLTTWRRQPNGAWRVIPDVGAEDAP